MVYAPILEKLLREREADGARSRRIEALARPTLAIVPRPAAVPAGGLSSSIPSATAARVGRIILDQPINAIQFTYRHNGAGSGSPVLRFALYNESGSQRLFNKTHDASGAAFIYAVSLGTHLWLPAGHYYLLCCLSSGTTSPAVSTWATVAPGTIGAAPDANTPDLEGTRTISGGAAPATFDPAAITTPTESQTPVIRLDGR